jgi:hypothetical protein
VVIEASPVWEHFFDAAASTGADVVLSHPTKIRLIAEASLESDRVDSEALATLLRLNAVPEAFAPEGRIRELRHLVRDRFFFSRKNRSVQCHIYSALLQRGIPYDARVLSFKGRREALRSHGIPEVARGLDLLAAIEGSTREINRAIHAAFEESTEAQLWVPEIPHPPFPKFLTHPATGDAASGTRVP